MVCGPPLIQPDRGYDLLEYAGNGFAAAERQHPMSLLALSKQKNRLQGRMACNLLLKEAIKGRVLKADSRRWNLTRQISSFKTRSFTLSFATVVLPVPDDPRTSSRPSHV